MRFGSRPDLISLLLDHCLRPCTPCHPQVNDIFQGKGKYTWPNGCCYDGFWRDNKMHGDGTYRDINGREWRGRFYNGRGPGLSQEPG